MFFEVQKQCVLLKILLKVLDGNSNGGWGFSQRFVHPGLVSCLRHLAWCLVTILEYPCQEFLRCWKFFGRLWDGLPCIVFFARGDYGL